MRNEDRKVYQRRCPLCLEVLSRESEQIMIIKYYEHLEKCRKTFMKKFEKSYYKNGKQNKRNNR